ncbi:MAG TPA: decaprenyl-phosphate phosphoribosyltransferase, partial [Dehalococcoidia bacterium]|nr:decaprenyl-phosphate phosphoribosyltransferase [Dehalococcoidia bacterium]
MTSATPSVSRRSVLVELVASFRPKQWAKNALVFLALVFSVNQYWTLADLDTTLLLLRDTFSAFLLFSVLSSAEYLVNDLVDVAQDREHPQKRYRPLAAGRLSPAIALGSAGLLAAAGLLGSFLLAPVFGLVAFGYVALMVAYTFVLKHLVILDVFVIAGGFLLRAVGGAVVIGVPVSPWLYLCTTLGALFVGLTKRRQELVLLQDQASNHRRILQEYTPALLDQMINVVTSSTVITYSLYTFSAESLPANHAMMLTIP